MGKKRRIINRIHKFGKKYFAFLDGLDGTRDSQLLSSKLDTMISEIKVSDRGNQTMSLQFEGFGPGASAQAVGLEKDRVMYSIDGVEVNANGIQTFAAKKGVSENTRDNLATTAAAPARSGAGASDVILAPGEHTIAAHILGEGAVAASVEVEFTGDCGENNSITLISHDGTSKTYNAKKTENYAANNFDFNNGNDNAALTLKNAIDNAAGHDGKFTVVRDGAKLTITNATVGAAGNRDIVSTLNNVTISNGGKIAGGFDADDTKSKTLSKKFHIKAANLGLVAAGGFAAEGSTDGNLTLDITKISATAGSDKEGCQPGVESVYKPFQTLGSRNGYKIQVFNGSTALGLTSGSTTLTRNDGAGLDSEANILAADLEVDTTLVVVFTALDASNAVIPGAEVRVSVAIDPVEDD